MASSFCSSGRIVKILMNTFLNLVVSLVRRVEAVVAKKDGQTSHYTLWIKSGSQDRCWNMFGKIVYIEHFTLSHCLVGQAYLLELMDV